MGERRGANCGSLLKTRKFEECVRLDETAIKLDKHELQKILGRLIGLADILKTFDGLTIYGAIRLNAQLENILSLYQEVAGMWKLTNGDIRTERRDD
jgi:hypothetical protein